MNTYRHCDTCHRPMRHARKSVKDHPGTIASWTATTCKTCVERSRRTPVEKPALIRPCVECGRDTHPGKSSTARPPGIARRIAGDMCSACYNARRRDRLRASAPIDPASVPYIRNRRRRGIPMEGTRSA